jgi:hypothetical protein
MDFFNIILCMVQYLINLFFIFTFKEIKKELYLKEIDSVNCFGFFFAKSL